MIERRALILRAAAAIVGPSIVRVESIMRVASRGFRFYQYTAPAVPYIGPNRDGEAEIAKCMAPNGRLWKLVWTYYDDKPAHYMNSAIGFSKMEYRDNESGMGFIYEPTREDLIRAREYAV